MFSRLSFWDGRCLADDDPLPVGEVLSRKFHPIRDQAQNLSDNHLQNAHFKNSGIVTIGLKTVAEASMPSNRKSFVYKANEVFGRNRNTSP